MHVLVLLGMMTWMGWSHAPGTGLVPMAWSLSLYHSQKPLGVSIEWAESWWS
jgi:hypothetical protein